MKQNKPPLLTGSPALPPNIWRELIGDYERDSGELYILEKDGSLMALAQEPPLDHAVLEPQAADLYAIAGARSRSTRHVAFLRNKQHAVTGVRVGKVVFVRRPELAPGEIFRLVPQPPVDRLLREASVSKPPVEKGEFRAPDLVDPTTLDATIQLDIRYATSENFMSAPMYSEARAFLARPAASALVAASQRLHALGYGLVAYDAYRPWYVTKMFWDGTPADKRIFVANPSKGSRHNRGCAADLTLYSLRTGRPVAMPGGYDEMSERSFPKYPGGTSLERWNRGLLREVMRQNGFTVNPYEWWHFDYKDWREYSILNLTFAEVSRRFGSSRKRGKRRDR